MSRNTLAVDVAVAAFVAILLIVIAPGLAVVGIVAVLVLVLCGVSFAVDRRARASRRRGHRARS